MRDAGLVSNPTDSGEIRVATLLVSTAASAWGQAYKAINLRAYLGSSRDQGTNKSGQ